VNVRFTAGRIIATTPAAAALEHLFILRIEHGRGVFYVPQLTARAGVNREVPSMNDAQPRDRFVPRVSEAVAHRLVQSGLYEKEARAMVDTWRNSYFRTDGLRLLVVLPQSWTDRFILLEITPAPAKLVRVMVGRIELLDAARERRAEEAIRNLASRDEIVRAHAFDLLRAEGRYVEPIIRRTLRTTSDPAVRTLSQRLLLTDFVTGLRAALASASTDDPVRTDPAAVRAQREELLRETGLNSEAGMNGNSQTERVASHAASSSP